MLSKCLQLHKCNFFKRMDVHRSDLTVLIMEIPYAMICQLSSGKLDNLMRFWSCILGKDPFYNNCTNLPRQVFKKHLKIPNVSIQSDIISIRRYFKWLPFRKRHNILHGLLLANKSHSDCVRKTCLPYKFWYKLNKKKKKKKKKTQFQWKYR